MPPPTPPLRSLSPRGRRSVWLLIGLTACLTMPLILAGWMRGRGAHDQLNFHEKAVRAFAAQWPAPALDNYLSATTPGYHLVLAAAARAGLDSLPALRMIGLVFTLALVGVLGWWVSRRLMPREAVAVCLPVVCSLYVIQSGAWLLPDNAGWVGVLAVLLVALRARFDAAAALGGAAALVLLVCFRQSHVWAAAPLWVAGWWGTREPTLRPADLLARDRGARSLLALAATLPAFAAFAWFAAMWDGLTPPRFQDMYQGAEGEPTPLIAAPAAPAFFLSLLAIGSVFFAGWLVPGARAVRVRWFAAAALGGLLVAAIPPTTYDAPDRSSGIWNAARAAPVLAGRSSLVFLVLAPLGAAALLAWMSLLPARTRWILMAAIAGFVAAQMASLKLWQRYSEPFVLVLLALMAGCVAAPAPRGSLADRLRAAGPAALAAILLAVAALEIIRGNPATDRNITLDPSTTIEIHR